MSFEHITERTRETHRNQWAKLRGQGNLLDMERAHFLFNILRTNLNNDHESLEDYLVVELEEYRGKRSKSFVRAVEAFEKDKDENRWRILGAHGMVLLTRIKDGRTRQRVLSAVLSVLKNTKRDSISISSFRGILQATLGRTEYNKVRLESRRNQPAMTYREQAIIFQRQILALLPIPGVRKALSHEVRVLLRLDQRKQSA